MLHVRAGGSVVALALLAGCGAPKVVPVSGVVKVDGQPCKNVVVRFQPAGGEDAPDPGHASLAVTDADGRFTLVYDGERPGALVGRHRVRIFPQLDGNTEATVLDRRMRVEKPPTIPAEWNESSTKEYDVPAGGTDRANFDIATGAAGTRR